MSTTAMDAAAFTEMKELMGEAFLDIISLCLQDLPEQSMLLETAISNNDANQIFNIAHRLKSSCGTIGAYGLAKKAEAIEIIGREGSTQGANEAFTELQLSLEEVLDILKKEIS
jgi:HPt (histidine-containing phosphotransfer) domain-containing protein